MEVRRISRETLVAVYHLTYNVAQLNKPREMHFSVRAPVPDSTGCGCHPLVLMHHLPEDAGSRLSLRHFFTTFPSLRDLLSLSPLSILFLFVSFCQRFFASANIINPPYIFLALGIVQLTHLLLVIMNLLILRVTFIRLFVDTFLHYFLQFFYKFILFYFILFNNLFIKKIR